MSASDEQRQAITEWADNASELAAELREYFTGELTAYELGAQARKVAALTDSLVRALEDAP